MNFYLVRHGDKPNVSGDPGISELGVFQSKLTGEYLKDKNISKITSSPFKRTLETAQEISKVLNLDFSIDERLKERLNFGDEPNLSIADFLEIWNKTTKDRDYKPMIGSSSRETGNRVLEVLAECEVMYPDKNIVLVTHGGVIYDVLRNLFEDKFLRNLKPNFLSVGIRNCSITHLVTSQNQHRLMEFDYLDHIQI